MQIPHNGKCRSIAALPVKLLFGQQYAHCSFLHIVQQNSTVCCNISVL